MHLQAISGNRGWIERIAVLDLIGPPPSEPFSETNDSVAILLTYGMVRVLLAGDAEAREEYMASGPYTRP